MQNDSWGASSSSSAAAAASAALQRFGSGLELNAHLHTLTPDIERGPSSVKGFYICSGLRITLRQIFAQVSSCRLCAR